MLLGVHCSVSGGIINAFDEAEKLGINTFQIFTKNQRQWREKEIDDEEGQEIKDRQKNQKVKIIFSHSSYLINSAARDESLHEKSLKALTGELQRCDQAGLAFTVLHPGAAKDQDPKKAMEQVAKSLTQVLKNTSDSTVKIALENTAGQGTTLGRSFEELKNIADQVDSDRIVFCFDTCHAFSSGYDIRSEAGIKETLAKWEEVIGLDRLAAFHLNDSKGELGSHIDRHEHIGHGEIGDAPFEYIMQNFPDIPKVIETPKKDDWDEKNLERLRSFVK